MKRISGGQLSREAKPRFYQVTPVILGRRRATQALPVRPGRVDAIVTSQPAASPRTYRSGRTSPAQTSALTVTLVREMLGFRALDVRARQRRRARPASKAEADPGRTLLAADAKGCECPATG